LYKLFFFLPLIFVTFSGCNTTSTDQITIESKNLAVHKTFEVAPSKIAEDGLCMADTLSFLVGQPESALQAMDYPDNTRVLIKDQPLMQDFDPTRLNLVLGRDRSIVLVYCG
jgi:hypothetical protein